MLLLVGCFYIDGDAYQSRVADLDQDGFDSIESGGTDCHDEDATIFPGAKEVCGDGVDGDCDGDALDCRPVDRTLDEASAVRHGEEPGDYAGSVLELPGDVDGNGWDDVLVGAYGAFSETGRAYLVSGPVTEDRSLGKASAILIGEAAGDQAGIGLGAAGDLDGDGRADLLVGAPGYDDLGAVYLLYGPVVGNVALSNAAARIVGESAPSAVGYSSVGAGDLDGDGHGDLLIADPLANPEGLEDAGAAYVLHGPFDAETTLTEAYVRIAGTSAASYAAAGLSTPGDVDGDGAVDFWLCSSTGLGTAWLFYGPLEAWTDVDAADVRVDGEQDGDRFGSGIPTLGDVDHDGRADLAVLATGFRGSGRMYVFTTMEAGTWDATRAELAWTGTADSPLGPTVSAAGDVDGDGWEDLILGRGWDDRGGEDAGAAELIFGPLATRSDPVSITGTAAGDHAGWAVAGGSDLDGDGVDDVVVGGYGPNEGAGAVWVIPGAGV